MGNKWSDIAEAVKTKTENQVKNYFYSSVRKVIRKIIKMKFSMET